jgi:hypothetical protein
MSALDKYQKIGIVFRRPAQDQVELPEDITTLSSEQLAEVFTALTAWADYLASQKVMAELEERNAKRILDLEDNKMLISRMGAAVKGERITLVKAQIAADEKILALTQDYEEKYAYRKLVEMLLINHERDIALISREITRRSNDQRANRKDYGI